CGGGGMGGIAAPPQRAAKQTGKAHRPARSWSATRRWTAAAPMVPEILDSPGQPLDVGLARELQARLGFDFSRIRIHADEHAAVLTRMVGADAVAVGSEVFFAPGKFAPHTVAGRRLVMHELVHTVQAPVVSARLRAGRGLGVLSRPSEPVERAAESVAEGGRLGDSGPSAASMLRYATVTPTQQRIEQLDPATLVDRIVAGVLRS